MFWPLSTSSRFILSGAEISGGFDSLSGNRSQHRHPFRCKDINHRIALQPLTGDRRPQGGASAVSGSDTPREPVFFYPARCHHREDRDRRRIRDAGGMGLTHSPGRLTRRRIVGSAVSVCSLSSSLSYSGRWCRSLNGTWRAVKMRGRTERTAKTLLPLLRVPAVVSTIVGFMCYRK